MPLYAGPEYYELKVVLHSDIFQLAAFGDFPGFHFILFHSTLRSYYQVLALGESCGLSAKMERAPAEGID